MTFRTGSGFDIHRLKDGIPLFIGGINIPFHKGSLGHSDGDALIHALCDAILGALNLGDLGNYFPSNGDSAIGLSSITILKKIDLLIVDHGATIGNIDCTIILQEPKISSYIPEMKQLICDIIHVREDQLSIKSKTTDTLGSIGESEAIAALCTVLVEI